MRHKFRASSNTDRVDIRDNCVGVDAWVVGDSVSSLNTNRGLHTQVRHNGDKRTFDAACELARLYAAAPELFEALEYLKRCVDQIPSETWHRLVKYNGEYSEISPIDLARDAIRKATGGDE